MKPPLAWAGRAVVRGLVRAAWYAGGVTTSVLTGAGLAYIAIWTGVL